MEDSQINLSAHEAEPISPSSHGDVLTEGDHLIDSGKENFMDWETAKLLLLEELKNSR